MGDLTESEPSRAENAPLSAIARPVDMYARETFSLWLIQVGGDDRDGRSFCSSSMVKLTTSATQPRFAVNTYARRYRPTSVCETVGALPTI